MTYRYIDDLQNFVKTYNSRQHRSIGLSPNDGELKQNHRHIQLMHKKYYEKVKPSSKIRFQVGDLVRIARLGSKFGRGYEKKSPEAIYRVRKVIKSFPRVMYEIETYDEEKVLGFFYSEELTKILDQDNFIIEKILKEDKRKGRFLVKWLGYEQPSWVDKKDMTTIKDIM